MKLVPKAIHKLNLDFVLITVLLYSFFTPMLDDPCPKILKIKLILPQC